MILVTGLNYLWNSSLYDHATATLNTLQKTTQALYERVIKNILFQTTCLAAATLSITVFMLFTKPVVVALTISLVAFGILGIFVLSQPVETKKRLWSELSLLYSQIMQNFWHRSWWHTITPLITLGAIPLQNHLHLLIQEGHTAVLSLVEPVETEPHLGGVPLGPEDWHNEEITFCNLPNPDLTPVKNADVITGVQFLHEQTSMGKRVYVHCMAGLGRSAIIVICYLTKHNNMSSKEAAEAVYQRRYIAVNETHPSISEFAREPMTNNFPMTLSRNPL